MAQLKDTGVSSAAVGAEEVVTPFQQPIRSVQDNTAKAIANVVGIVEEGFGEQEKTELNKKFKDIKRFRTAADQGKISYTEARTRAAAAVKESINAMPWRAQEFRKEASTFFGAYGEGWGILNKSDAESAAASREAKLELAYAKGMQSRYNMPYQYISSGKKRDAAVQTQLELEAKGARTARDAGLVNKSNVLDVMDQQTRPLITGVSVKMSNILNNAKVGGKTVLEMRIDGLSDKAILDKLSRDDQAVGDLTANIVSMIAAEQRNISAWYDNQLTEIGTKYGFNIGADQSKVRKDALLSGLNELIKDVSTNTDAKALFRFVQTTELANKGSLSTFKANNMSYYLMRESGIITDDVMTKWLIDPENTSIDPKISGMLKKTFDNVVIEDLQRWWDQVKVVPSNFEMLSNTSPDIANLLYLRAKSGIPNLMSHGWDKDSVTKEKQQDFFTSGSYMHLFKTSANHMGTVENFEKLFFDPSYQKMFHSLPADKQQKIVQPLRKKMIDIMYNEESGNGVIQRLSQTVKDTHNKVVWDVGTDGNISVNMTFLSAGEGGQEFQKDIQKDTFGDNLDRLNKYISTFSSLMPDSFNKQDFTNKIIDSLIKSNPDSKRKETK